jgi:two-component system, LytTR family, response regulator
MVLTCLIVDDEPLAQDILKDYVAACPELKLVQVCDNALEAGKVMQKEKIDLLFLDINMPMLTGIGFIRSLSYTPLCVFVTAYPQYAVEGFEVDALDYLLKPVDFGRFRKAVNRALERMERKGDQHSSERGYILVKADKKNYRIAYDDLLFLEALGDYVIFRLSDKKLMAHGTMKQFLSWLPASGFQRIHKSYAINLKKVDYMEGNQVKIGNDKLPVSLTYREKLVHALNSNV